MGANTKSKCTSGKTGFTLNYIHCPLQREAVVIRGLSSLLWEDKPVFTEIKSNLWLFLSENTALKIVWTGSYAAKFKEESANWMTKVRTSVC